MISILLALLAPSEGTAWKPAEAISSPATWFTSDDYPAAALRSETQGTVAFRFEIKPDGSIGSCDVTTSSGSQLLDDTTCSLVRMRARYRPAINASGKPATDYQTLRFTWKLPDDDGSAVGLASLAQLRSFEATVTFDVTADGAVENCRTTSTSVTPGGAPRDPCDGMRNLKFDVATAAGPPRRRTVTFRTALDVRDAPASR